MLRRTLVEEDTGDFQELMGGNTNQDTHCLLVLVEK